MSPLEIALTPTREQVERYNMKAKKLATDYTAPANSLAWGFIVDYSAELAKAGLYRFKVKHCVREAIRDYERFDRCVRMRTPKGAALLFTSFYDNVAETAAPHIKAVRAVITAAMEREGIIAPELRSGASMAHILARYAVQNFDTSFGGPLCSPEGQVMPSIFHCNISLGYLRCTQALSRLKELEELMLPPVKETRIVPEADAAFKKLMLCISNEDNIRDCYRRAVLDNKDELAQYEDGREILEIGKNITNDK